MRYNVQNLENDLKIFASVKDAEIVVGGLSKPSKMPWYGWSISAKNCKVGGKLAKVPGSVCHNCYALKGRYAFDTVQNALNRRQDNSTSPLFVPAFIFLLNSKAKKIEDNRRYFRWFDSGDLQSIDMLYNIDMIARYTPTIRHWLPTKESTVCRDYIKEVKKVSPNLTIRLSANMIDDVPPKWWPTGSAVFTQVIPDGSSRCPAPQQENQCRDCRTCWSDVSLVAYHEH